MSPDVGTSTNLGGWINKAGIWSIGDRIDWFADDTDTLVRWRETDHGQHIELGIAEVNLVGLLGELGATWSRDGQPLLPVGTIYDPFVARALEPWSFGIYAGGQSILVGTPSGVTLGPGGRRPPVGDHALDRDRAAGLRRLGAGVRPGPRVDASCTRCRASGAPDGTSAYFRLSTRPIDQALHAGTRERGACAGGYRLRAAGRAGGRRSPSMGALVPEAVAAADMLEARPASTAEVVCITSADLLFRAFQARAGLGDGRPADARRAVPARRGPIVTLLDGHPHTLGFLGAVHGVDRLPRRPALRPVGRPRPSSTATTRSTRSR